MYCRGWDWLRVYYQCVLYEDIEEKEVPTDKAKIIANKLDNIGIAKFNMVYELPPELPAEQAESAEQPAAQVY